MTSELKKILAEKNRAAFLEIFLSFPFYPFLTWPYFHDHIFQHGSAHCWTQGSRQQLERRVGKCGQRSRLGSQSWDLGRGPEATAWTQRSMEGCGWVNHGEPQVDWLFLLIGCVEHCGTIEVRGAQLWAVPCNYGDYGGRSQLNFESPGESWLCCDFLQCEQKEHRALLSICKIVKRRWISVFMPHGSNTSAGHASNCCKQKSWQKGWRSSGPCCRRSCQVDDFRYVQL